MISHPPIPTRNFADHVDQLKSNDGARFSHEYESIEPGQQFTWDASNLDVNKPKNRYANVIAYDHSRVVLQSLDGVVGSDYINANFMDGYRQQNAYIATQVRFHIRLGVLRTTTPGRGRRLVEDRRGLVMEKVYSMLHPPHRKTESVSGVYSCTLKDYKHNCQQGGLCQPSWVGDLMRNG